MINDNNFDELTNDYEKKRKRKNGVLILLLIIVITLIFDKFYTEINYEYSDSEYDSEYQEYLEKYSEEFDSYSDYKENIQNEEFKLSKEKIKINGYENDNKLICEVFNENEENVTDLRLYVIYYDNEKRPIAIEENYIDLIYGKNSFYCEFDISPDSLTHEFLLVKDYDSNMTVINLQDIQIETNENEDEIITNVKNNSKIKVDTLQVCLISYNNEGKIYDIETRYIFDLKAGKEDSIDFYDFDDQMKNYKVIINYAYSYNN